MKSILSNFCISGDFLSAERYGEGHINETYLAQFDIGGAVRRYILQRISKRLTNDIPALMKNIELVTEFITQRVNARGGESMREGLMLVKTKNGKTFHVEDGEYYRVYIFIEGATSHQTGSEALLYEAAYAFGSFANLLSEFDATMLTDTIPNFHHTPTRLKAFKQAVDADTMGRAKQVSAEIDFVLSRASYAPAITSLLEGGILPYRVTHNDTKLNNVMIDDKTGKGIAVIDLDTVMAGSLCYDFGDAIRFGCNPAAEDEQDLSKVVFNVKSFEAFTRGYLAAVGKSITSGEKSNLVMGAYLMTYECGMRFLTDYLSGDVYFHTKREGQNLDRARTQFKLIQDMEMIMGELNSIVIKS